jgi:hypothetical protein
MKIELQDEGSVLQLTDENMENDNYVTLRICVSGEILVMDVLLTDLMSAAIAFDSKQSRRLYRENPCS